MKQTNRGGRELPIGQGCAYQIKQNRLLHFVRNDERTVNCNDEPTVNRRYATGINLIALIIYCVLFSVPDLLGTSALAQSQHRDKGPLASPAFEQGATGLNQLQLRGKVVSNRDAMPIEGASVSMGKSTARTDKDGKFKLSVTQQSGTITVKHIGYQEQRVAYDNTSTSLNIALQATEKQIEEVEVVSTGYQKIPKERAT